MTPLEGTLLIALLVTRVEAFRGIEGLLPLLDVGLEDVDTVGDNSFDRNCDDEVKA